MPVYTGGRDDVCMEEDNFTQHEEDSLVLTGVKQKPGPWSGRQVSIPCAKASTSCYNTGIKQHLKTHLC